jgi:hypothetical protein
VERERDRGNRPPRSDPTRQRGAGGTECCRSHDDRGKDGGDRGPDDSTLQPVRRDQRADGSQQAQDRGDRVQQGREADASRPGELRRDQARVHDRGQPQERDEHHGGIEGGRDGRCGWCRGDRPDRHGQDREPRSRAQDQPVKLSAPRRVAS